MQRTAKQHQRITVSVIIPSYNQKKTIRNCLDSVLKQKTGFAYEVIVVDSSNDGTADIIREYVPLVKMISLRSRAYAGKARNIGIKKARGDILAFTDTDCVVDVRWIESLCRLHRRYDVVCGTVKNGNPKNILGWSMFLMEFADSLGTRDKLVSNAPTCNISYKRRIFSEYGLFPEDVWPGEDFIFNCRLKERIFFSGSVAVKHINRSNFSIILRHSHRLGYCDALGVKRGNTKGAILLTYPFLTPLVVFYRFIRIGYLAVRAGYILPFLLTFPLIFINLISWDIGLLKGILAKRHSL